MTTVRVVRLGLSALVWAEGVLDGAVAPELHETMEGLVGIQPRSVVLDLSSVPRIDHGAMAVLAAAAARLGHLGVPLELRLPAGREVTVGDAHSLREVLSVAYPPRER
ncbi:MAG TPA: STAS domain-containing protein [Rugosimonospora sp.]|nr:STAS domain-containing protein [Rugosimonospora sp.]